MIEKKQIADAKAHGVCFLCTMCERWHTGIDAGLKDEFGEPRCSQDSGCAGPIWGGTFHEYMGPLAGHKTHWCYLCGEESSHVLAPKSNTNDPIGVCKKCLLNKVKKLTARELPAGQHSTMVSERCADPDRHEVIA